MRDDYKTISEVDYILYILEKTNIKDIKTIIIKRAEGYENREIAEIINVNKNTIETRLRRLKERLLELGITA